MQEILKWLYATLQPLYSNPVLTYQDVSLILSVFKDVKIRTEIFNNQLLLKIYTDKATGNATAAHSLVPPTSQFTIQIYLPTNYPQTPPIVTFTPLDPQSHTLLQNAYLTSSGHFTHPLLESWHFNYKHVVSNDGIAPRENRLLVLLYTIHRLISENPSIWMHQIPSLPPKPTRLVSSVTPPPSTASTIGSAAKPNVPPLPQLQPRSPVKASANPTSLSAAPPQLPPNPIRMSLIKDASAKLNSALIEMLNGNSEYSSIPKLSTILENQNNLVTSYDNYNRTEKLITELNANMNTNTSVIDAKCVEAKSLIDAVNAYVAADYNIDEEELFRSTNEKSQQLSDLCFQEASYLDSLHFLELLFNTQKISFTDYTDKVRKISRERAKLLVWINKFK